MLTPAALNFFVTYADGAVESLWSIDQYFEFVLVLMLSTGLSFQVRYHCIHQLAMLGSGAPTSSLPCKPEAELLAIISMLGGSAEALHGGCCTLSAMRMLQVPIIQILLGNTGIVTSEQMLKQWRFVVVGATVAAAVLTPSTDPFTQTLLAVPLIGLYLGGAGVVRLFEQRKLAQGGA